MSPEPGARALLQAPGPWVEATLRARSADGTWVVAPDLPADPSAPLWFGVTARELSVGDRDAWEPLHAGLGGAAGFGRAALAEALARAGLRLPADALAAFWAGALRELFALPPASTLTSEQSWRLLRRAGLAAASVRLGAGNPYTRVWAGQVRMGGRDPAEVARPVTLADTFAALGLADAPDDPRAAAELARFEARAGVAVPRDLAALWRRAGALPAIGGTHPAGPDAVPAEDWIPERGDDGRVRVAVLLPADGGFRWTARLDPGAEDAPIEVAPVGGPAGLAADRGAFFFWDLAQTGAAWIDAHGAADDEGITAGEVGYVRRAPPP